jgi:hypothetical protein
VALNDIESRNGEKLTERVWALIDDTADTTGVPCRVVQGGFGGAVNASAGTHDVGDVFDLSMNGLTDAQGRAVIDLLRRRNGCAWIRSAKYGWTKTSAHIHCVMRDSHYGLSAGARKQVTEYDNGYDGLSGSGRDPFPRPPQKHWEPAPPTPAPLPLPTTTQGDKDMILQAPSGAWYLLTSGHLASLDQQSAANAKAGGMPTWKVATTAAWGGIVRTYPPVPA